jgi:hypothetical protein
MNLLTTELNSLVAGTLSALGPEINNSSGYQEGMLSISLASATFVAGAEIDIFLVPSNDTNGTAYPTLTSAAAAGLQNYYVGTLRINGSTAAQKETLTRIPIPLGKFKACALTRSPCPTLASSGNTVDLHPTPSQY